MYANKVNYLISRYINLMFCEYLWLCFEMFYTKINKNTGVHPHTDQGISGDTTALRIQI